MTFRVVSNERLRRLANEREALHFGHATSRPLSEGYEFVGMLGERAFSERFNVPMDLAVRPGGDGGSDFWFPVGRVDVKTARKEPWYLPVEHGKVTADIYVLAWAQNDEAELLGWEWALAVYLAPLLRLRGHSILNHAIRRDELRPMDELQDWLRGDEHDHTSRTRRQPSRPGASAGARPRLSGIGDLRP